MIEKGVKFNYNGISGKFFRISGFVVFNGIGCQIEALEKSFQNFLITL